MSNTNSFRDSQKSVDFISKQSLKDFSLLPEKIKTQFAHALERISCGSDSTLPIDHLGEGLIELKINGSPAYRCVYYNKLPKQVVVVHSFKKTTNGPDRKNVDVAKDRLKKLDTANFS